MGMALTPYKPEEERKLLFHPLSSRKETCVSTSFLRNSTYFSGPNCVPGVLKFGNTFYVSKSNFQVSHNFIQIISLIFYSHYE